jgi:transposase
MYTSSRVRGGAARFSMGGYDIRTRHELVAAYKKCGNFSKIAREFNVDRRTVVKWVIDDRRGGHLEGGKSTGRVPSMSRECARQAKELMLSNNYNSCTKVAEELHAMGLTKNVVHSTTVSRRVKAQAKADKDPVLPKFGKPAKRLTEKTKAQRLSFCKANKKRAWTSVMITDRKKFHFKYPGCRVKRVQWVRRGEQHTADRPNNPMCVNMYAGITCYGVTKAHLVTGTSNMTTHFKNQKGQKSRNITSEEYREVLTRTLLPEGHRLLHDKTTLVGWVLQQDNDPTHKRSAQAALQDWNAGVSRRVMLLPDWPPNSPDLSPIENAWAWVQAEVDSKGCKNFEIYQETLLKFWENLPPHIVKSLMRSIPARLRECVRKNGEKTSY